MSGSAVNFDIREQIARIDNLREEALKFAEEQRKLAAEAAKLERDRYLSPLFEMVAVVGAVLSIINFLSLHIGVH